MFPNDGNNVIGGSRQLANDFLYGGPGQSITITGLELGAEYVATIYSVGWENGTRAATFSVGNDRLTVNQDHFGDNNGIRFIYRYIATDVSVTLRFDQLQGNSIHVYGFSNYELNPPPVPEIVNASFEVDAVPGFPGYGSITGWSLSGNGGINNSGGPFHDNRVIPDGAKVAFVQGDGSGNGALSQIVSGFIVGLSYQIRYFENARNCCGGTAFVEVKVAGNTVVTAHASPPVGGANPYREVVSDPFVATASSMEIAFIKSNPQGGDNTLLLDNVSFLLPGTVPSITVQSQSQAVGEGSTVTLTVAALGSAPLSYQWSKNGSDISGANNSSLTFSPVAKSDAGTYAVRVSNAAGDTTSADIVLTVRDSITTLFNTGVDENRIALGDGLVDTHYALVLNPDSASSDALVQISTAFPIVAGPWLANNDGSKWIGPRADTTGAAGVIGGSGGDYIYRASVDLTGFDPSSIVINGGWTTDNEGLDILINGVSTGQGNTAGFGALTPFSISSGFLAGINQIDFRLNNAGVGYTGLRVDRIQGLGTALPAGTAPFIVQQPQPFTATLGERVTYSVRANGSSPLSYQWFFGLDAIPGETGPTLSFTLDFPDQAGDYSVEITSPFGSKHSDVAALILREAPAILTQPQSQGVADGEPVTFSVIANGFEPLEYQWTKGDVDIAGANGPTFTINSVVLDDAGDYRVRVSNFAGDVTSSIARLAVLQVIPGLFNTGVDDGGNALADGAVDPHYALIDNPDTFVADSIVEDSTVFPIVAGPWVANEPGSKWIGPRLETSASALGDYTYATTFDLSAYDPTTVRITGEWATDNEGQDVVINSTPTGQRNTGQFVVYTPFTISGGFAPGLNELQFKLNNSAVGYTGLRVRNLRALGAPVGHNVAPRFTRGADITVASTDTVPAYFFAGWATGIRSGPPGEPAQALTFIVTTDNPGLFATAPAINSANGALSLAVGNATGVANVTVVLKDDGGTANGGTDQSAPQTFVITVLRENHCPAGVSRSLTVTSGSSVPAPLLHSDSDGDAVGFITYEPSHGSLTGIVPDLVYRPEPGFTGTDSFTYYVTDGRCTSEVATVTITVLPDQLPPTAVIVAGALVDFSPDFDHPVLISCNWWNACLVLDGTLSSDPENGPLTYLWFVEPNVVPLSAGAKTTNCLEVGTHTIVLAVTDSDGLTDTETRTIEVVTAPLAIELLIEKINQSSILRRTKRELVATLRVALNHAGYDRQRQTQVALSAFEKKVRAQVVPGYPVLATSWIRWSQAVTEGMEKCIKPPKKPKGGSGKGGDDDDDDNNNNEPN